MPRTFEIAGDGGNGLSQQDADDTVALYKADGADAVSIPFGQGFKVRVTYPDAGAPAMDGVGGVPPAAPAVLEPAPPDGPPPPVVAPAAPGPGAAARTMSSAGYILLRKWEGCILFAYDDANGQRVLPGQTIHGTLTIGYGHTGTDVFPGLTWSTDQAEEGLTHDVAAVIRAISPLITGALSRNQFSAFVCFAFNIGTHAFAGSSALELANAGNLQSVPSHMLRWNKTTINGALVSSSGLTNRRNAEIALWNTP